MAYDSFGNWISGVHMTPAGEFPGSVSGGLTGDGPPDSGLGDAGNVYVDLVNNTFYYKTDAGWILLTGGGTGGSGQVGVVDPEGVVTAEPGTPYFNSALATFWYKSSGSGNTGWAWLI